MVVFFFSLLESLKSHERGEIVAKINQMHTLFHFFFFGKSYLERQSGSFVSLSSQGEVRYNVLGIAASTFTHTMQRRPVGL